LRPPSPRPFHEFTAENYDAQCRSKQKVSPNAAGRGPLPDLRDHEYTETITVTLSLGIANSGVKTYRSFVLPFFY